MVTLLISCFCYKTGGLPFWAFSFNIHGVPSFLYDVPKGATSPESLLGLRLSS